MPLYAGRALLTDGHCVGYVNGVHQLLISGLEGTGRVELAIDEVHHAWFRPLEARIYSRFVAQIIRLVNVLESP